MDLGITMKTLLVSFEQMNHPLVLRLSNKPLAKQISFG